MTKKEARVLGLSVPTKRLKQIPVIGIVFRGNLWLDAILTCQIHPTRTDGMSVLARAIIQSRQYSQIRAVILSKEDVLSEIITDIPDFSDKISLPVISIAGDIRTNPRRRSPPHRNQLPLTKLKIDTFSIEIAGGLVHVKTAGIGREETREIFGVACADGKRIPEAVRIAKMVAEEVTERSFSPGTRAC